ncbi:MAG: sugar phosphate isomerase/epimerase family protein [Flavihumibacter sp.]
MHRRKFIATTAAASALLTLPGQSLLAGKKASPKLCFSTLGCPEWSFAQILDFAAAHHYQGIEIRGIQKEMDLPKSPVFATAAAISNAKAACAEKKIPIVGLGSSCELHHPDTAKRNQHLDNGKRFIDLAAALGGVNVRVFPNSFVPGEEKQVTINRIVEGLQTLAAHARGTGVNVLLETHGQLVWTADLLRIMQQVPDAQVGLIWDFYNMWTVTKEPPAAVYAQLKPYIRHTHLKDSLKKDGQENYVLFGKGEGPAAEAVKALKNGGYWGYYSFEWEKLWHPEIAEPDLAIGAFPAAFMSMWQSKR